MSQLDRASFDVKGERPESRPQPCDQPGCTNEGAHRAPRSRDHLTSYYWFCLDHVRGYNAKWDYFAGMDQDEIDAFRSADVTGHRPTWPIGPRTRLGSLWNGAAWRELFALFAGDGDAETQWPPAPTLPTTERDALAVMDLRHTATQADIKTRFKQLVKRHHPDANGGDKTGEERLKVVINAYRLLVRRRSA